MVFSYIYTSRIINKRLYGEVNIATNDQQNIRYKHTASIENETIRLGNKYYESQNNAITSYIANT